MRARRPPNTQTASPIHGLGVFMNTSQGSSKIVVPMTLCDDDGDCAEALAKFLHEMGAEPVTQPKLSVTASSLPGETMTVLLESRGKQA